MKDLGNLTISNERNKMNDRLEIASRLLAADNCRCGSSKEDMNMMLRFADMLIAAERETRKVDQSGERNDMMPLTLEGLTRAMRLLG